MWRERKGRSGGGEGCLEKGVGRGGGGQEGGGCKAGQGNLKGKDVGVYDETSRVHAAVSTGEYV